MTFLSKPRRLPGMLLLCREEPKDPCVEILEGIVRLVVCHGHLNTSLRATRLSSRRSPWEAAGSRRSAVWRPRSAMAKRL